MVWSLNLNFDYEKNFKKPMLYWRTLGIIGIEWFWRNFYKSPNEYLFRIGRRLSKLNRVYVKFLQALAGDLHLIDDAGRLELTDFCDSVPVLPEEYDFCFEVSLNKRGLFLESRQPINSGLIALVYRAYDKEGRKYVVKVKRHQIEERLQKDLDELEYVIKRMGELPYCKSMRLEHQFAENKSLLTDQLDFFKEVDNIKTFERMFKNVNYVNVPHVYEEYTAECNNIIVMDYVEGIKLQDVAEEDKESYCTLLAKFGLKCTFFDGIYHADLHPGNILFQRQADTDEVPHQLAILDFGVIGRVTREEQNHFYEFIRGLFEHRFEKSVNIMLDHIVETIDPMKSREVDAVARQNIVLQATEVLERSIKVSKRPNTRDMYDINIILARHGLRLAPFFCRIQMAFVVNETMCNYLSTEQSFSEVYGHQLMEL